MAMEYRSISFHQSCPDKRLIELGHKLGYNDITFQTECGTLEPLYMLRKRADKEGYFDLAQKYNMTTSLWVHELEDIDEKWGKVSTENQILWQNISKRYFDLLNNLFPEIDNLVLTVVETQFRITGGEILIKLVDTIIKQCRKANKKLILRTFVWHPKEQESMMAIINRLPVDVIIMTKCVPQDWHMRSINHPLIGKMGSKKQYVEYDIAGEYFKMDHVANCFTDILSNQFRYAENSGCEGIAVRVDRGMEPLKYQNNIWALPQEANLWVLSSLAKGESEEQGWDAYTKQYFGGAQSGIKNALYETGKVVAEALCVKRETFGDTREAIPAIQTMRGKRFNKEEYLNKFNPFFRNWSVFRWDEDYVHEYQSIITGDKLVIQEKEKNYSEAQTLALNSIDQLDIVGARINNGAYKLFKYLLQENLFLLRCMCEMELAWMKMCCRAFDEYDDNEIMNQVNAHINNLKKLNNEKGEIINITYRDKAFRYKRGAHLNIEGFITEFVRYWSIDCDKTEQ